MAVFVSASDESDGGHHRSKFWHGGFVGPEKDWCEYFAPAWQERILDAKPPIPYLHMTEIRDPQWRAEHGITWLEAQDKLDEAAVLIDQMGSLYPIATTTSASSLLDVLGKKKTIAGANGAKPYRFLADHFAFNTYVFTVLFYIHAKHPDVEKVDFIVDRKEGVFEKMKQFYYGFADSLTPMGESHLVRYLGELIPASKERVPVQVADMMCWHASRKDLGLLNDRDARRGYRILARQGALIEIGDVDCAAFARALLEKVNEQEHGVSESTQQ